VTGKRETLHQFSKRVERKTLGTISFSVTFVPGQIMKQNLLQAMLRHMEDREVI